MVIFKEEKSYFKTRKHSENSIIVVWLDKNVVTFDYHYFFVKENVE